MAIFAVTVEKASVGQGGTGGGDATVLEQVEAGRRGRGRGGRGGGRLHGRENESEAVGDSFVGCASQGWSMTCDVEHEMELYYCIFRIPP